MRITFDDKSFVECKRSDNPGKVMIVISASDRSDPLKKTTNAVEISQEEFQKLVADVL
jgi:hypothetical protein